jgi:hypothetical protein
VPAWALALVALIAGLVGGLVGAASMRRRAAG